MTEIYRCLPRKLWSVREGGRVVGHVDAVALSDVTFHASASGVKRIVANRRREVVAFARGRLVEANLWPSAVPIWFCPYSGPSFVDGDGEPVLQAHLAYFLSDGSCWGILS